MPDERHNDPFHWKNKLEELDHLPTERAADKTELWKRLHARLSQKHNKTKPGWYLAAAACVLFAIGISWLFVDVRTGKPVTEKPVALPQQSSNKSLAISHEGPRVDTQHINVITKGNKKAAVLFNSRKNELPEVTRAAEQDEVSKLPDPVDSSQVSDRSTFPSPDTVSSNSIAATPYPRRLRVIHINDLEKSSEHGIKYAGTASASAQRKKSTHGGVSAFSLSKNTSDDIVKVKLSPSN